MDTPFDFGEERGERIVYVRPVKVADLPPEMRAQAGGREVVWAVHDADGEQLALVAERTLAFVLARQNDLKPVSLH